MPGHFPISWDLSPYQHLFLDLSPYQHLFLHPGISDPVSTSLEL